MFRIALVAVAFVIAVNWHGQADDKKEETKTYEGILRIARSPGKKEPIILLQIAKDDVYVLHLGNDQNLHALVGKLHGKTVQVTGIVKEDQVQRAIEVKAIQAATSA